MVNMALTPCLFLLGIQATEVTPSAHHKDGTEALPGFLSLSPPFSLSLSVTHKWTQLQPAFHN